MPRIVIFGSWTSFSRLCMAMVVGAALIAACGGSTDWEPDAPDAGATDAGAREDARAQDAGEACVFPMTKCSATCDAISIGLGFDATRAVHGDFAPKVAPPVDPCGT